MKVKIQNDSHFPLPEYATEGSVAMDLRADLLIEHVKVISPKGTYHLEPSTMGGVGNIFVNIPPDSRCLINTGLKLELPEGHAALIFPRSGTATKRGLTLANAVGVIDSDYRGYVYLSIFNISGGYYMIEHGERLAQLLILPVPRIEWVEVENIAPTDRGAGGFGSTGKN